MAFSLALTQALYVVLFLRDKISLGQYELVPAGVISENLALPKPSVVKILTALTRAGIVVTGAGVNGGARLAAGALEKTVFDVFAAIEGTQPIFRTDHEFPAKGPRPDLARGAVTKTLQACEGALLNSMRLVPLGTLVPEEPSLA